jgi:glycerophosphoryl diester phosphodiesterase|tara:strand:+ start:11377 stop:12264 length:888 start_codon:yes stop_codon:yes gene_type:complete
MNKVLFINKKGHKKYIIILIVSALLLTFILFYSQIKPNISNLSNNKIGVLGHRGMSKSYRYPGNSLPSILEALKRGAIGSEIDVQLAKDGKLIIYHHRFLDKYTNFNGKVSDYTTDELSSCYYNGDYPKAVHVISVDNLFSTLAPDNDYIFSFDCKFNIVSNKDTLSFYTEFIDAIELLNNKYGIKNKIFIEADHVQFHRKLKERALEIRQFITGNGFKNGIKIAKELDLFGIGLGSKVSKDNILEAHSLGLRVMTWTPTNDFLNARAVRKYPDYIQTGDIDHLVKFLGESRMKF